MAVAVEEDLLNLEESCIKAIIAVRAVHTGAATGVDDDVMAQHAQTMQTALSDLAKQSATADATFLPSTIAERIDTDSSSEGPIEWVRQLAQAGEDAKAYSACLAESFEAEAAALASLAANLSPSSATVSSSSAASSSAAAAPATS